MSISERLKSMRLAYPECVTIAFADISTQTVLASSHRMGHRQEHLNDLCATAVEMFATPPAQELVQLLELEGGPEPSLHQVVIREVDEVGIFLKSLSNPTDAMCCVCGPNIDIASFMAAARSQLEEIGTDS